MEQTASGILVPDGMIQEQELTAEQALQKYYEGMGKMERIFPQLVKLAISVATVCENFARQKSISSHSIILDVARWHPDGWVVVKVSVDPEAKRVTDNDGAMKNFHTLAEINATYPQAVELSMSLAYQLVGLVNSKKLMPSDISVGKIQFNPGMGAMRFKMFVGVEALRPPIQVLIR